jgi:hypothetical protein
MALPCLCAAILWATLEPTLADPPESSVLSARQFFRVVDANLRGDFLKLYFLVRLGLHPPAPHAGGLDITAQAT